MDESFLFFVQGYFFNTTYLNTLVIYYIYLEENIEA